MSTLARALLHAAPEIAVAVATAAVTKSPANNDGGGGGGKPASKPPFKVNALDDLEELIKQLRRVTGVRARVSITDTREVFIIVKGLAEMAKKQPSDSENILTLVGILGRLNRDYPRYDDGTEHETPCRECGKQSVVTLPVEDYGDMLVTVCSSCGESFTEERWRYTQHLAVAMAQASQVAAGREKRTRRRLEAKYGNLTG